jgi:hypothetical protein
MKRILQIIFLSAFLVNASQVDAQGIEKLFQSDKLEYFENLLTAHGFVKDTAYRDAALEKGSFGHMKKLKYTGPQNQSNRTFYLTTFAGDLSGFELQTFDVSERKLWEEFFVKTFADCYWERLEHRADAISVECGESEIQWETVTRLIDKVEYCTLKVSF